MYQQLAMGESRIYHIRQNRRINTNQQNQADEDEHIDHFQLIGIFDSVELFQRRAEKDPLDHPQNISGASTTPIAADQGIDLDAGHHGGREAADKDQEFGGKAAGQRQTQGSQTGDRKDHRDKRRLFGQSAQFAQVAFFGIMHYQPGHGKEQAGDDAVAEHLQAGADQADLAQGKDTQQNIAHVADAAVGDQPFQVGLPERHRRAVDNADDGQNDKKRSIGPGYIREDADADADHAVAAHLQQGSGQDHADAGGGIGMGIRQPGMQREDRQLDGKTDDQQEEDGRQRYDGGEGSPMF